MPRKPLMETLFLKDNLIIYGLGSAIAPFIGLKLINMLPEALHLA